MKKSIFNNVTEKPSVIWRNNINLRDPSITEEEKKNWTQSQIFEYKFNNTNEYINGSKSNYSVFNFPTSILEEYPEYLDGWDTIITNTGLICFYKAQSGGKPEKNFVIYDMFDDDNTTDGPDVDSSFLSDIKPDISMLKMYNMFDQSLSVRRINFTNNEFTPERSYNYYNNTEKKNKWCGFFNCDGINYGTGEETISTDLNDNFFFETTVQSKPTINYIQFNYKPLFVFKIYNTDGTKKIEEIFPDMKILINGIAAEKDSDGIYFIDLSARESRDLVSISLQNCGDGYLEVI